MPRRSADIGASTSRPLIRRRERNCCSQLLFVLVFYVANEDPRRATRPQRVPSKPDHPHLKASLGGIGSGGWIRTSDQLINSQLRYHCATPEQSSDGYYIIFRSRGARGEFRFFRPAFILSTTRNQGTLTGSKRSVHGRPCLLSSAMNGSGSNSSHVCTPFSVHFPSRNIFAPIIAGTPVV